MAVGIAAAVLAVGPQAQHAAPAEEISPAPSASAPVLVADTTPSTGSAPAGTPQVGAGPTGPPAGSDAAPEPAVTFAEAATTEVATALAASGIPSLALRAYVRAAAGSPTRCHIEWSLLAAIGRVESNHGRFAGAKLQSDGHSTPPIIGIALNGKGTALIRDTDGGKFDRDRVYDHAVGPMQFIPSTWAVYASDGNGDGQRDPFNIHDAAAAGAKYLCAAGKDLSSKAGLRRAVLAYNHSDKYVAKVLNLAATYAKTPPPDLYSLSAEPPPPAQPTEPPADPAPPAAEPTEPPADPAPPAAEPMEAESPPTQPPVTDENPPQSPGPSSATAPASAPLPAASPAAASAPPPTSEAPAVTDPAATTAAPSSTTPPAGLSTPTSTPEPTATPGLRTPTPTPTPTPGESPAPAVPSPTAQALAAMLSTPPTPAPQCSSGSLLGAPVIVDIRNGSGDPAVASELAARLAAAGIQVGAVAAYDAVTSAVQYPDGQSPQAGALAVALGLVGSEQLAPVDHLTLVIGVQDSARLFAAPLVC
jgi:membrane-bound lytic murein transglycosylase B